MALRESGSATEVADLSMDGALVLVRELNYEGDHIHVGILEKGDTEVVECIMKPSQFKDTPEVDQMYLAEGPLSSFIVHLLGPEEEAILDAEYEAELDNMGIFHDEFIDILG